MGYYDEVRERKQRQQVQALKKFFAHGGEAFFKSRMAEM